VTDPLDNLFSQVRTAGRAALFPYLTAGFPDPAAFVDLAVAVLEAGADALEIGIPFSDPLLDGPSIQRSQQAALDAGVTPRDCLRYAARIHQRSEKPLIFFGAYNPTLAYGPDRFAREAAEAGVNALIVPDLPVEEQGELHAAADSAGLHLIQLVAPTSGEERLRQVCAEASGFIYCISVAGVTGARTGVSASARPLVERVRACRGLPVVVGFGIASPETARAVGAFADGVAVGSALIDVVAAAPRGRSAEPAAAFIRSLHDALAERAPA
jgi:tryptophan synthase alpha chain